MSRAGRRPLTTGDVIGGYELLQRIGQGGTADVWIGQKADVHRAAKMVALKVIAPHLAGQEHYSRMFRAEAELAAMLTHSNIVQVFDEGESEGISYLVMEYVDGISLVRLREGLKFIGHGAFKQQLVAYVIGQLLHALSYAHNVTSHDGRLLRIVHRDVSPQNVLISNAGDVKLTDFGVAHTVLEESSGIHVKGKLRYMAPEQLSGMSRKPTIDLFAVGALLHELLEGEKFRGDFEDERVLHAQVVGGVLPKLSQPVPWEFERVRRALLEPNEHRRIQTANEAIRLLSTFPGYRDMRMELAKLCGSLTGIALPRGGLQRARQPPLAEASFDRRGYVPRSLVPPARRWPTEAPTRTSADLPFGSFIVGERRDVPTRFPGQDRIIRDAPWLHARERMLPPHPVLVVLVGIALALTGAGIVTAFLLRERASPATVLPGPPSSPSSSTSRYADVTRP